MAFSKNLPEDLGPIPGQSFFDPPGGPAWERPPKHVDVETAMADYVDQLDDNDVKEVMFSLMDAQVPLDTIVNMVVRGGQMKGLHSVDVGVMLRPMIHEYYGFLAEQAGIKYVDTAEDLVKETRKKNTDRQYTAAYLNDLDKPSETEEALPR